MSSFLKIEWIWNIPARTAYSSTRMRVGSMLLMYIRPSSASPALALSVRMSLIINKIHSYGKNSKKEDSEQQRRVSASY